jgi:hypothetical protein
MGNKKYRAIVGIDHGDRRAEPGDVIQWLPDEVAEKLEAEGAVEHYTKSEKKPEGGDDE